jgi:hypothetical protein
MAKKAAKAKKTAKAKKATRAKPAKTKSLALKPPVFHVSIQKVLEKMKAIAADSRKEEQFLDQCAALKDDRFIIANARLVQLVKEFAPSQKPPQAGGMAASLGSKPAASDGETCF